MQNPVTSKRRCTSLLTTCLDAKGEPPITAIYIDSEISRFGDDVNSPVATRRCNLVESFKKSVILRMLAGHSKRRLSRDPHARRR
jgi:hypothetical protein